MQAITIQELTKYSGESFVDQCYRKILRREPDPQGRGYYLERLASGHSRISVIRNMAGSAEAKSVGVRVDGLLWHSLADRLENMPVLGHLVAVLVLLFTAKSLMKSVRYGSAQEATNQLDIQNLRVAVERIPDIGPVLNTLNSTHQFMRDIQRQMDEVSRAHSQDQEYGATVEGLERRVREFDGLLDPLRNLVNSMPGNLRQQALDVEEMKAAIKILSEGLQYYAARIREQEGGASKKADIRLTVPWVARISRAARRAGNAFIDEIQGDSSGRGRSVDELVAPVRDLLEVKRLTPH